VGDASQTWCAVDYVLHLLKQSVISRIGDGEAHRFGMIIGFQGVID